MYQWILKTLPNVVAMKALQIALTTQFLFQTMHALQHTIASPSVTCDRFDEPSQTFTTTICEN